MADTVVTLRPDGTTTLGGWTVTGAGSGHAATSDNSDASYIDDAAAGGAQVLFTLGNLLVPSLAAIHTVTLRVRAKGFPGGRLHALLRSSTFLVLDLDTVNVTSAAIVTYTYLAQTHGPGGVPWTNTTLNALELMLNGQSSAVLKVYEVYLDVAYNQAPVAVAVAPSGSVITTSSPILTHTYSDPEGDLQERFHKKIFTAAQYTAGGFSPETSTPLWDSGVVIGANLDTSTQPLIDGSYRWYVKVADAGSGGRFGQWDAEDFVIDFGHAAAPVVTAVADEDNARVALNFQGRQNQLSANAATMEASAAGWEDDSNSILTRSATEALNGAYSLRAEAAAPGDVSFRTAVATEYVRVDQRPYTALAYLRAGSTTRVATLTLQWRDEAGALLSSVTGEPVDSVSTGWTPLTVGPTEAPANAIKATILVTIVGAAAGELHYLDKAEIVPTAPNLLTANAASLETDLTQWQASTGALLSQTDDAALQGSYAAKILATGSGTAEVEMDPTEQCAPVTEGETYSACMAFRSATTDERPALIQLVWVDAADADISSVDGAPIAANGDEWLFATVSGEVAPGGAVKARLVARFTAAVAGDVLWADCAGIMPGTDASYRHPEAWTAGGIFVLALTYVERSTDGGATWGPVRLSPYGATYLAMQNPGQFRDSGVWDSTAPRGVPVLYRALTYAGDHVSETSAYASVVLPTDGGDWLKNPLDPTMNMRICLEAPLESTSDEDQVVGAPLGRPGYVVSAGDVRGEVFNLSLAFETDAEWAAFEALRAAQTVLLLQSAYGEVPEQWYVRLGATRSVTRIERGADGAGQLRLVSIAAREARAPT